MNHTGTIEIKTQRLLLRRFTENDADAVYHNYGNDPLVNRYISFAPCADPQSTRTFIQMHRKEYEKNPAFYGWAMTLNDEVIGSIGLFDVDEDLKQAELGYSLGSRWWGNGYATEAARGVLQLAFADIGFHRLCASHHIENEASGKVLRKIGMQYEGTLRDGQRNRDGSFSDLKLYGILEEDWRRFHRN